MLRLTGGAPYDLGEKKNEERMTCLQVILYTQDILPYTKKSNSSEAAFLIYWSVQ